MSRVYIDSNIFFYARIMDKSYGESCSSILRSISAGKINASISTLVPIEVVNALRKYRLNRSVAAEVRAIMSLPIEIHPVEASDVTDAVEVHEESGGSPYDCVHVAIMKRHDMNVIVSADRDFDRIGGLRRVDPKTFSGTL